MNDELMQEIDRWGAAETDEVLESIGRVSQADRHQALPRGSVDWIADGKLYVNYKLEHLTVVICKHPTIIVLRESGSDERTLAIALADILLAASLNLPIAQISVLLARIGVARLCKGHEHVDVTKSRS